MLLLLLLLYCAPGQGAGPLVCLEAGACYQGSYNTTSSGRRYASYQGVRYAQPPTGSRRFLAPSPATPGEAVWDVSGESTIGCPQRSEWSGEFEVYGQEDCLFLNIYRPEPQQSDHLPGMPEPEPLPVMVWIHGGALLAGAGTFQEHGPQHLLDREVVVVTLNYRLGALGFLCMGTEMVPGNAGLRDQALALHWVQTNIRQFGGDAGRVTVFGESAGSSSVALQLVSPLAEGTFQRAVLQSGTALGVSWGAPLTVTQALHHADLLAQGVGCDEESDVLGCLQGRDLKEILGLMDIFPDQTGFPWQAVPDSSFTAAPFLPAPAEDLLQTGRFNTEVEVILGTTKDEGLGSIIYAWTSPDFYADVQKTWNTSGTARLLGLLREDDVTEEDIEKSHKILDFYVGGVENITEANVQGLIDMMTDSMMLYGVHKTIGYLLDQGVTVYQYILTHRGEFSITQKNGPPETHGVSHADDLIYEWEPVFGRDWDTETHRLTGDDVGVRDMLTGAWAAFARTGDPSPPGAGVGWQPVGGTGPRAFLNISGPRTTMMDSSQAIADRMLLWQTVVG